MKAGSIYLGFDHGSRRIGVAVGDSLTGAARPLATTPPDWNAIGALLKQWQPTACVVGLPLTEDGGEQPASAAARAFAAELGRRFGVAVHTCDERHSTVAAEVQQRERNSAGRRRTRGAKAAGVDAAAACLILEQWLGGAHRA